MSIIYQALADDWYANHLSSGYDHDHVVLNDIEIMHPFYKWAVEHEYKELADYLELAQMVYWLKKIWMRISIQE